MKSNLLSQNFVSSIASGFALRAENVHSASPPTAGELENTEPSLREGERPR